MAFKPSPTLITCLILPTFLLISFYSTLPPLQRTSPLPPHPTSKIPKLPPPPCNLFTGKWVLDPTRKPTYNHTCKFQRNAWNCFQNQRNNMARINSWKWVPENCDLGRVDPVGFLGLVRDRNIGFVGDSLNENFMTAFLCVLSVADEGAKRWKRKGAWKGAYFPKYNVTVAYHRAVLLAKYEWQDKQPGQSEVNGTYRVDVDVPASDWANIADFYDVLIFNTGHWWGFDKFPKETPLVFYKGGRPINPPLEMTQGMKVVLEHMIDHIDKAFPQKTLKFWRLQSPRHFHGGDWNQNGSCLFDELLDELQLDLWFDPSNNGVNKEARLYNQLIEKALNGSSIRKLDLTHMSEFRADAHPAMWLGKKDAVAVWGQDCMHWCLPGVPDIWVDILTQLIIYNLETGFKKGML